MVTGDEAVNFEMVDVEVVVGEEGITVTEGLAAEVEGGEVTVTVVGEPAVGLVVVVAVPGEQPAVSSMAIVSKIMGKV